jgi:hypothetical protein
MDSGENLSKKAQLQNWRFGLVSHGKAMTVHRLGVKNYSLSSCLATGTRSEHQAGTCELGVRAQVTA